MRHVRRHRAPVAFRRLVTAAALALTSSTAVTQVGGQVFRWDNGQLIPATAAIPPAPGASFASLDLSFANLASASLASASFSNATLNSARFTAASLVGARFSFSTGTGVDFSRADLRSADLSLASLNAADFTSADLTGANLSVTTLVSAVFTDARITNADLSATTAPRGFTTASLYSTASWKSRNLAGVNLSNNNHAAWNFASQNLKGAGFISSSFSGADFTSADLSLADVRFASNLSIPASANTRGLIAVDGSLPATALLAGETLRVRSVVAAPPVAATTLTGPASSSLAIDPGARVNFAPPTSGTVSVRPLDGVALRLNGAVNPNNGFLSVAVARVTPATATVSGRTAAPLVSVLSSLTVTSDNAPLGTRIWYGRLDLGTNDAIIRNGASTLPELRDLARVYLSSSGLQGLGSSSAFSIANTRLAVTANRDAFGLPLFSSFDGVNVTSADALVKFTWIGDTDLSGTLDARDFNTILSNWSSAKTGADWQHGDTNYDGLVDATDWSAFLTAYTAYLANPRPLGNPLDFSAPTGGAAIPEPTALALLTPAALLLRRRR